MAWRQCLGCLTVDDFEMMRLVNEGPASVPEKRGKSSAIDNEALRRAQARRRQRKPTRGRSGPSSEGTVSSKGSLSFSSLSASFSRKRRTESSCSAPQQARSQEVIARQQEWVSRERAAMQKRDVVQVGAMFRKLLAESRNSGKEGHINRVAVNKWLHSLGTKENGMMMRKLFALFDANGTGLVGSSEFAAAVCFLSQRGSATDRVAVAHHLFDSDRDGKIGPAEFGEMAAALCGNKVSTVLRMPYGLEALRRFLNKEMCDELLDFLEAVGRLRKEGSNRPLPRPVADEIFSLYVEAGSDRQINVSAEMRENCRQLLAAKKSRRGRGKVTVAVFEGIINEVLGLLEEGPLQRFKKSLASEPEFTAFVWRELGLEPEEPMSLGAFRVWVERSPGTLLALDKLHQALSTTSIKWGRKGAPRMFDDSTLRFRKRRAGSKDGR